MTQYINKDAVVAEIENMENDYKKCPTSNSYEEGLKNGRLIGYEDALDKINAIEVKEVDLEKELDSMITPELKFHKALPSLFDVAKHFFELGLKAQKGE